MTRPSMWHALAVWPSSRIFAGWPAAEAGIARCNYRQFFIKAGGEDGPYIFYRRFAMRWEKYSSRNPF